MIGEQPTGRIEGIVVSMVSHEPPAFTVNGKPAQLAILADDGTVIAAGQHVAKELSSVVVNSYRAMWKGQGHLRIYSEPIMPIATVGRPGEAANSPAKRKTA